MMRCCGVFKAKIVNKFQVQWLSLFLHHLTSSPLTSMSGGQRLLKSAELPRIRETYNCCKSCCTVTASSSPVCLANTLPSFLISAMAEECQAPRLSAAMGMNSIPWWRQDYQDLSSVLRWATYKLMV